MADGLQVKPEHGLVYLTVAASWAVHHVYMNTAVVKARKQYKVDYPKLYADGDSEDAVKFNCVQRAHQNSLEYQPIFLSLLAAAGLKYPALASGAGAVYLAGRIAYFEGYATGQPKNRMRGAFMYLGVLPLVGATVTVGVQLLRGWRK